MEDSRRLEKRQNQWYGKQGNGGYARPEMRTEEDDDPEIGVEQLAEEKMKRILIKRAKQNSSPLPRNQVTVVGMEKVRFESPKRKRGEESIAEVPEKKRATLQKTSKKQGETDNLTGTPTPSTSTGITDENRHQML